MKLDEISELAQEFVHSFDNQSKCVPVGIPDLMVFYSGAPTTLKDDFGGPVVCLPLQGVIEIIIDSDSIFYGKGESVLIGHNLPSLSRITEATLEKPFLALIFALDVNILKNLQHSVGNTRFEGVQGSTPNSNGSSQELVAVFHRYINLIKHPIDLRIMAPLVRDELHYRILQAHHALILKRLLRYERHWEKIASAIEFLKNNYRFSISIDQLAKIAGMGVTSFHEHFRTVTQTSPRQYQKQLQLVEARRMLLEGGYTVSSVAYHVGYKSPTQFSREYSRKYGEPPSKHLSERSRSA